MIFPSWKTTITNPMVTSPTFSTSSVENTAVGGMPTMGTRRNITGLVEFLSTKIFILFTGRLLGGLTQSDDRAPAPLRFASPHTPLTTQGHGRV